MRRKSEVVERGEERGKQSAAPKKTQPTSKTSLEWKVLEEMWKKKSQPDKYNI